MSPELSYQMFLAIKLHFTTKYDYFLYNGKTKADLSGVQYRRDKWNFVKIGKKYDTDLQEFLVANFIAADPIQWSGALVTDDAEKNYKEWLRRKESFTYIISEECDTIKDYIEGHGWFFDDLFEVKGGQHPILLKLFFQNEISIDTLLTFAAILGFMPKWDREIDDDIIWPDVSFKLRKYQPFVRLDKSKLKQILREKFQ